MKKILFLILPLFFFLFLVKPTFAQNDLKAFNGLFSTASISNNLIFDNTKDTTFTLLPFTKIIIQANTFAEKNITFLAVSGDWDKIKSKYLPKDQSPITSYFFVFTNSANQQVRPSKPLKIETYNNFTGTSTFYYPLDSSANIDVKNKNMLPGPILAKVELPVNDYGFVIGVNKILDKNNPAFTAWKNKFSPSPTPGTSSNAQMAKISNLYKIIAVVILLAVLLIVGTYYYSKNRPRKSRRIEEPKKIIVGGK